jgi:hypothetical protein
MSYSDCFLNWKQQHMSSCQQVLACNAQGAAAGTLHSSDLADHSARYTDWTIVDGVCAGPQQQESATFPQLSLPPPPAPGASSLCSTKFVVYCTGFNATPVCWLCVLCTDVYCHAAFLTIPLSNMHMRCKEYSWHVPWHTHPLIFHFPCLVQLHHTIQEPAGRGRHHMHDCR